MPLLVTRTSLSSERQAFYTTTNKYSIAKLRSFDNGKVKKGAIILSIFTEIKEQITARAVAEGYGLKVRNNGLACCPFHNDKHPSMKIDKNYHCFACGAGGDAVDYVSRMFGLSQYEAALKLIEDFRLPIEVNGNRKLSDKDRERIRREKEEHERVVYIKRRFQRWCNRSVEELKDTLLLIKETGIFLIGKPPDMIFSDKYAEMLNVEPVLNYWLDILCMGTMDEKQELFLNGRKEVAEIAAGVRAGRARIMEQNRGSA
jgi:hypothetical protein